MTRAFDADDAWHLAAGSHTRLWEVMGAHPTGSATTFRVWAPNASAVSVVSERNGWRPGEHALEPDTSGVWRGTFDGYSVGDLYKFSVVSADGVHHVAKSDPFARASQIAPETASIIAAASHDWSDADWMTGRGERNRHDAAISTYEVHLGSWRYEPGGYEALARQLADYCVDMGFTHVELLPIMEHPFYGSWGYQSTGYFAPTARYGRPDDVMQLVDILHQAGVGVILDWVPSHFPTDEAALGYFDGTHLYEHADPKQGFHPDWKSFVFNYGRPEVRSFLLSSAHFWLDEFHVDGLRVDAVASMLYLDYSREDGEWIPNIHGGNENLEAVAFLQDLNRTVYGAFPDVLMVAEESTAWPGVTNPADAGGLGFAFKWDMGWMHDTLEYLSQDPIHRQWHHDRITFRSVYQASENYVLPLSHDEVVHGKGSLLTKMPGDRWQQFANLRLLLGYQWTAPGKKLLFMGGEFGSPDEWNHEAELPWPVLGDAAHAGVQGWVRRINELYREVPALHRVDRDPAGFRWVVNDDHEQSVLAFLRSDGDDTVLVVMNNTPAPRHGYRLGATGGTWELLANSDDPGYGGSGMAAPERLVADGEATHGFDASVIVDLPPLALLIFRQG
ncbi:MAG: 1,4-alpha-glucan branching protein GlgB [Ilumatobacteraceae bacterium]|nr:1,4-alpha-glucan branching protein GlgB [Ilumatobacteraceae bacterium]